jgi:hypothetical protein
MSSPTCNSPTLSSCGKRPRTPETPVVPSFRESIEDFEDEPFAKMPRSSVLSTNDNTHQHDRLATRDENESMPLAPRLSDFMAPGGTARYRPRPEWYLPKNSSTGSRKNAPNVGKEGVGRVPGTELDEYDNDELVRVAAQRHAGAPSIASFDESNDAANQNDNGGVMVPIEEEEQQQQQQQQQQDLISVVASASSNNPSLLVAPADGLLPEGAFQDYSVGQEAIATGGGGESPPAVGSSSTRTIVSANPKKQRATDVLLVDASTTAFRKTPAGATGSTKTAVATKPCFFGKDWDTALNLAIRENATEAALALLACGAAVDAENAKGITPLILASQKGDCTVVRELLSRGANPGTSSTNGTTALLQAAHFGHGNVVELLLLFGGPGLMELSNYNHTTPLMRASQVCAIFALLLMVLLLLSFVTAVMLLSSNVSKLIIPSFLVKTTGRTLGNLPQSTCLGSAGQS